MNYPQAGGGWQQMPPQPYPGQPYAPGYAAPPKKRKTWLWILLAILVVIILAVGGAVALFNRAIDRPVTVTYEVTGSGQSASVRYSVKGFDDTKQEDAAELPWTMDVEMTEENSTKVFQLTAYPRPGERVECKVSANGEVLKQAKSDVAGGSVRCWGAVPLF